MTGWKGGGMDGKRERERYVR